MVVWCGFALLFSGSVAVISRVCHLQSLQHSVHVYGRAAETEETLNLFLMCCRTGQRNGIYGG